jgi:hypothetical protein
VVATKLGVDYALGVVVNDNLDAAIMRLIPSPSRCEKNGDQKLVEFMEETGIRKFRLVPVPECGSHLEALKKAVVQEEERLALYPICTCKRGLSYSIRDGKTMCLFCEED